MATVSKKIADEVVAGNGYYPGDYTRVVKIVKYSNMFDGGDAYGLVYENEPIMMYENSPAVRNLEIYWEAK